jgi:nitronate monooxygenase
MIRDAGVTVICQVTTVAEGQAVAAAGADIIVAQGDESGGHGRSGRSLFGLLPALHTALPDTPLVAAGGINGRQEFDAACALGASGVALGTAYYATNEALDTPEAKQRLVEATGDETVRGIVYDLIRGPEWPAEFSGRSIRTKLTDQWTGKENELRGNTTEAQRHDKAAKENDMSIRVVWAGEGLDAINTIVPAAEVSQRFPICR